MTTVQELRKELREKVRAMEPIELEDVANVNTFARMELMKEKTRQMTAELIGKAKPDDWTLHKLCSEYDMMAIDWVYSNRIEWEGSLADEQTKKIVARVTQ